MSGQKEVSETERARRLRSLRLVDYIHPIPEFPEAEQNLARLLGARDTEDITNKLDEMQKLHFKQRKMSISRIAILLQQRKQLITGENVDKFMKIIDECVRYLRWQDDSPFDEDDYKIFLGYIRTTILNIRPRESGDDEKTVSTWRKIVNYIMEGDYIVHLKELWSKVESIIQRLETGERGDEHVWDIMTEKEKRYIDHLRLVIGLILHLMEEQLTLEIWTKISKRVLPYVFKCMDSILVQELISDHIHPQVSFTAYLLGFLGTLAEGMLDNMLKSDRQHCVEISHRYLSLMPKTLAVHFDCVCVKAFCFTINELKADQPAEMKLSDVDSTVLLTMLMDAVYKGSALSRCMMYYAEEVMMVIQRYVLIKDNQLKLLEFRFEDTPETGVIDLILKGVQFTNRSVQTASLECLKIIADDEIFIRYLKTNEKCLPVLKDTRKSPHMSVRQKAVDVIMKIMIEKPNQLKVTRKRLERSSCIRWSDTDLREKMKDCGFTVQADTDMTGCDGEWLIELLVMRRENNVAYYKTIESIFGIKPDRSSLNFNLCMRKLEKMILSDDLSHEPDPYQSMNSLS